MVAHKMLTEKKITTSSGDVHYRISEDIKADKVTLFFLHGLTANHDLFKGQIGHFEDRFNIINWDAPAHGTSRPFENFTYEKAAHAARQILDENGISEAVFIGQSMGGFITQSVIKRFPEIVKAFVSIDSTPYGNKYYAPSDTWWLRQIEWMSNLYPDKTLRKAIAKQCTTNERSYGNMLGMLSIYGKKELCHLMAIGFAGFLEDNCDLKIECPVLLIVGRKDKTGKVITYNKQWSEDIGVPITWIENAAHNSNDDDPETVNRAIDEFLNSKVQYNG